MRPGIGYFKSSLGESNVLPELRIIDVEGKIWDAALGHWEWD